MPDQIPFPGFNAPLTYMVAALAFGYLLGSVPFGLIFGWLAGAGDVRSIGSGNIGATNVLRTGKRWAAAATLLCDAGKGALAALLARPYGVEVAIVAGIAAFLGHIFPMWLKFRGGKGVATFLGVTVAWDWRAGLVALGIWLLIAAAFRISSLSALIAASATPICFALLGQAQFAIAAALIAIVVFVTHRTNIHRLTQGKEPRIGGNAAAPPV